MNYSDFDKIEQDEWSLTRPTFRTPKGGILTVVGLVRKNDRPNHYVVQCSECKKDKDLHGEGLYVIIKAQITRGGIPCGCSKRPRWSKYQWKVMAARFAQKKGFIFKDYAEDYAGTNTKLVLSCPLHGEWKTTSLLCLKKGRGCPSCGAQKRVTAASSCLKGKPAKNRLSKEIIKKEEWATQGWWKVISYRNANSVSVACTKCNLRNTKPLSSLRRGIKCTCFGGRRKITDAYIRQLAIDRGLVFLGDDSKATKTKDRSLGLLCPKHGIFLPGLVILFMPARDAPAVQDRNPILPTFIP